MLNSIRSGYCFSCYAAKRGVVNLLGIYHINLLGMHTSGKGRAAEGRCIIHSRGKWIQHLVRLAVSYELHDVVLTRTGRDDIHEHFKRFNRTEQ